MVAFDGNRLIVGDEARELQANGDQSVASFFKRAMGDPSFQITIGGRTCDATQLSAFVLAHLRDQAADALGELVDAAVITVPAYFTNPRREATITAGRLAGLDVLSIISEPTAAALAYGLRPDQAGERMFLVYDLGGGTFDVSLVKITDAELRVVGTDGDHNLGGKDWDDRLACDVQRRFLGQFGQSLPADALDELEIRVESLKRSLSVLETADIRVSAGGEHVTYTYTRAEFEALTRDLLEQTRSLCDSVLAEANLGWADISGVVPVGGSTRLPMVRRLLEEMSGRAPLSGVQPDEAVALGAAVQAALDLEAREPAGPRFLLPSRRRVVDVMSHSLGMIATSSDESRYVNSILVKRNQPIPAQETRTFRLRVSRNVENRLEVFLTQAEGSDPAECIYLGKYVFTGMLAGSGPYRDIDVTYGYIQGGVVAVSATDKASGTLLSLAVEPLPDDIPARFTESPNVARGSWLTTVYLIVDLSGSMSGDPLEEAKKAAHAFLDSSDLSTTAIGIAAVADTSSVIQAASQDPVEVAKAVERLSVGLVGIGNAAHPFDLIRDQMQGLPGSRIAVVLADGVWANQNLAVAAAKRCHADGIEIVAVGFGAADRQFLKQISSSDESRFTDLRGLSSTFSSIAAEINENSAGNAGLVAT